MSGVVAALRCNAEYDQAHGLPSVHFQLGSGEMTAILYGAEWVHAAALAALLALTLLHHRFLTRLTPARQCHRQTARKI